MKRGTLPILLGLVILASTISRIRLVTWQMTAYSLTLASVALLWGLTDKLEARFPSR
jgi:hypothetical protein